MTIKNRILVLGIGIFPASETVHILDSSLARLIGQVDGPHGEIGRFKTRDNGRTGLSENSSLPGGKGAELRVRPAE